MKKSKLTTKQIVLTGMMTAVLAVLSIVTIPLPTGVPVTLQTFAMAFCGYVLGWKLGGASSALYLILGAIGVPVYAGMSGIDIALWDIKGKALNQPVWQLLGGKTNDNLRVYASQLQFNWGTRLDKQKLITPEEYAEVTRVAMADGYDAIKVDPIIFSDRPDGKGPWKITGPLTP